MAVLTTAALTKVRLHGLPHDVELSGQQLSTREPHLSLRLRDLLKSQLQARGSE